ncbi:MULTISPECIES: MFS transporter [Erwinia]|uniref:MFS transporter n=1 Tax=Erwinia TaxID=551 RepID=UPI00105E6826|nr:MFS transporter [Erwinia aphidicola]MCP2234177.1 MFS family permease [Erwinia aphidicola]
MTTSFTLSRTQLIRLQSGICLASFLGCLDFTIVNTALPALQRYFSRDVVAMQWSMTLFVMALCCCMVMSARLAERFGAKHVLFGGMLLFGVASLGAGLAVNLTVMNFCRLLQGTGCAVLYTVSASILVSVMPSAGRGRALGMLFAANGLGLALGPIAGGILVSWLGWRSVFLINVPLMLVSFIYCMGAIPTSSRNVQVRLDISGWLMMNAGLIPLLFLRVFLTLEKRTIQPLIDLRMLRNKDFAAACMLSVLLAIFYCSAFMLIPLKLVAVFQPSDARIGLMLLPVTLVMAVVSPIAGHAADRFTPWPVMAAGFIALSLSAMLQSFGNIPITTVFAAFILMGAGWGAILGPSVNAALGALPASMHAQGIGISWTLHNLGGALGLAIAAQIYQAGGAEGGFQRVMIGLAAGSLLAVVVALRAAKRASTHRLAQSDD